MPEYAFQFRGKTHHLKGLTDEVKSAFLDRVIAREYARLRRQVDAKLITPELYMELKDDARSTPWESRLVVDDLRTEEGSKYFLRLMIVGGDAWPDEAIEEAANMAPDSSLGLATALATENAYPKKPPASPPSTDAGREPSGGASSSANPSTSTSSDLPN